MNDIEKAIEDLKDIKTILKTQHMCKVLDDELTKKDVEDYKSRFASVNLAISALEKQLSSGWIPVSERLPNNCGLGVLLTIENKFQQRKVIQGFTGYMEKGKLEFHTNDKTTNLEIWKVIAWQPLPKPYKEVENE